MRYMQVTVILYTYQKSELSIFVVCMYFTTYYLYTKGFFDTLRMELADTGLNVHLVCPGPVDTPYKERQFGPTLHKAAHCSARHPIEFKIIITVCIFFSYIFISDSRGRKKQEKRYN